MNLTIQVSNLSPNVTLADLITFFSYCGTVNKTWLKSTDDQSQMAFVTFTQPYALQTALLLNDAIIADSQVRILPLNKLTASLISCNMDNKSRKNEKQGFIPAARYLMQAMSSKGYEILDKAKENVDDKWRLSEKRKFLSEQARMAILAVEEKAGRIEEAVMNNEYFTVGASWVSGVVVGGASWVSGVIGKAAKYATQLGFWNTREDLNSMKQK